MTPRELAIELLRTHAKSVARAISRQIDITAPEFKILDKAARVATSQHFLEVAARGLEKNDFASLRDIVASMIEMRRIGGVSASAIFAASHCYLPVVRRSFVQLHPDLGEALRAYEAVEALMFPVLTGLGPAVVMPLDIEENTDRVPRFLYDEKITLEDRPVNDEGYE